MHPKHDAPGGDPVARLAHEQVEETLRVSRLEAERSIGHYRLGIAAAMTLLSLVMERAVGSWEPFFFWAVLAAIAGAFLFAIRKFGAPLWLSLLAITVDLAGPILYLTPFTHPAALSEADARCWLQVEL